MFSLLSWQSLILAVWQLAHPACQHQYLLMNPFSYRSCLKKKKKDDEEITWPHTCSYWQPWSASLAFSAICAQTVGQDEQEWRHRDNGGKFKEREGGCFRHKKTGIHLCIVCQFHGPWYPRTLNSQSKASRELYLITLYIIFE